MTGKMKVLPLAIAATLAAHGDALTANWSDNANNETEQAMQAFDQDGLWRDVAVVGPDVETVDFDFDEATMKEFRIAARNAFGESYSNVVIAEKPKAPGPLRILRNILRPVAGVVRKMGRALRLGKRKEG